MKVRIENNATGMAETVEAVSMMSTLSPPAILVEFMDSVSEKFPVGRCAWFSDECDTLAGIYVTYTLIR